MKNIIKIILKTVFLEILFGAIAYVFLLMIAKGHIIINIIFIPIEIALISFMFLLLILGIEDCFGHQE